MTPADSTSTAAGPERTISQIGAGIRFATSLFVLAAGLYCAWAVLLAPKFQGIYDDMLGRGSLMPVGTRLLLEYHVAFIIGVILLTLIPVVVAIRARSVLVVIAGGSVAVLMLLALGVWASGALAAPIQSIIHETMSR